MRINNWVPETRSLINALVAAGYTPTRGDNGEDKFAYDRSKPGEFINNLIACDEAHLFVRCPDGKERWLYLVLGNEPGVIVSDYVCDDGLDRVTDAHYEKWCNRPQPTREAR